MNQLMFEPEYRMWLRDASKIRRAYGRKFNGKIQKARNWKSFQTLFSYDGRGKRRDPVARDRRVHDDFTNMRYVCATFVVTHFLEGLYLWNELCLAKTPITIIRQDEKVWIRIKNYIYAIPKNTLVNRFWFDVKQSEKLIKTMLWDLINRTSDVQEHVEERRRKELEAEFNPPAQIDQSMAGIKAERVRRKKKKRAKKRAKKRLKTKKKKR